jgi:glycosyltransferase involved in cell wall biosynthesis
MAVDALRICLLTYRGNPRSGGQGVYVKLLSEALTALGQRVDVWSGQPYPELVSGVQLFEVPSLDLWNEETFLRTPSWRELSDPINFVEYAQTKSGSFPEPLTFSRRVARRFLAGNMPRYDIVHDNQCLGPGLLPLRARLPVVATIHHPITVDRRIAFQASKDRVERYSLNRWYSFLPTQLKVSRHLDRILTVSQASSQDVSREYGVSPSRMRVVGNGIDVEMFRPLEGIERKPYQLITTLSSDAPLKGFRFLIEAVQQLLPRYPALRLTVIGQPSNDTDTTERVAKAGLQHVIEFTGRVASDEIARRYAEATVAVVPSIYEGFGFPAGEAMACQVPVVSTSAGALPEVVGAVNGGGVLVAPRSGAALAAGIAQLLDDPDRCRALGVAGRARVLTHFTWKRAAERTLDVYREAIAERRRSAC